MFCIYILYSSLADKYYVGFSSDPWRRLDQHLNNDGTKFTGSFKDWEISATFEASTNIAEAMKMERFIKRQKSFMVCFFSCLPLQFTFAKHT